MNIKKLTRHNFAEIVDDAVRIIKSGGIIIAPFDTVYGFIVDPRNELALKKIFELKKRPQNKTIGLAVDSTETLISLVTPNHPNLPQNPDFFNHTLIFKADINSLSKYCLKNGTVAIRIPNSDLIKAIVKSAGGVLAQTSANLSGQPACASTDHTKAQFGPEELDQVDFIIDGGIIKKSAPSKIFDLTGVQPIEISRN